MSDYSIALFLHVVAALSFFMALAIEWVSLRPSWPVISFERSREWLGLLTAAGRMGRVSMLALLTTGGYLMATAWGPMPWLIVALGAIAPFPVLAWALVRPRVGAIHRTIAGGGVQAESLSAALRVLWVVLHLRLGLAVGLIFLMTVKPGFAIAWTAMAVGGAVGLAISLVGGRGPVDSRPYPTPSNSSGHASNSAPESVASQPGDAAPAS